jgi:hypothetical protein
MGSILELIKLIYGSKALSKVLGTRTNVIRLRIMNSSNILKKN